jgi:5-hydroxyisourate hydrolase
MSAISTHVLDTSQGRPAAGVTVTLEIRSVKGGVENWEPLGRGETDADGRVKNLLPAGVRLAAATCRLTFDTGAYFSARGVESFYPSVTVVFSIRDATQHYHVPLLLSPYGYSTYRGS